jgi:hypothetical protein
MKRIIPAALLASLLVVLPVSELGGQTPTRQIGKNPTPAGKPAGPTFAAKGQTGTGQTGTDPGRGIGPFVPGKVYVVTSTQKTLNFAGKEIVLPQGVQFQFQDGYLIVSLPAEADRNVAVVRLGKTYLVVTKEDPLIIDPSGAPRDASRVITRPIRNIGRQKTINAVLDASDASPTGF